MSSYHSSFPIHDTIIDENRHQECHCARCSLHQRAQQQQPQHLISEYPPRHKQLRSTPSTLTDTLSLIVQLLSVLAAVIFGVWAVKSHNTELEVKELLKKTLAEQTRGNELLEVQNAQVLLANQLTLTVACNGRTEGVEEVVASACAKLSGMLKPIASKPITPPPTTPDAPLYNKLPTPHSRTSGFTSTNGSSDGEGRKAKENILPVVAACFGAVVLVIVVVRGAMLLKARKERRERVKAMMPEVTEKVRMMSDLD